MAYVFLYQFWLRPPGVALLAPVQDLSESLLLMLPALFTDCNLECVVRGKAMDNPAQLLCKSNVN